MAVGTNAFKVGNLVNSSHGLPDGTVATTASSNWSLAAAGTTQADATPITAQLNRITNNTTANGVILPVGLQGQVIMVYPALATNAPKVYPPVGGRIGAGAVNASATATAQVKTFFYCIDDTGLNWI